MKRTIVGGLLTLIFLIALNPGKSPVTASPLVTTNGPVVRSIQYSLWDEQHARRLMTGPQMGKWIPHMFVYLAYYWSNNPILFRSWGSYNLEGEMWREDTLFNWSNEEKIFIAPFILQIKSYKIGANVLVVTNIIRGPVYGYHLSSPPRAVGTTIQTFEAPSELRRKIRKSRYSEVFFNNLTNNAVIYEAIQGFYNSNGRHINPFFVKRVLIPTNGLALFIPNLKCATDAGVSATMMYVVQDRFLPYDPDNAKPDCTPYTP